MFKGSVEMPLLSSSFLQAFKSTKASAIAKNCFKCFILINLVRAARAVRCEPHGQFINFLIYKEAFQKVLYRKGVCSTYLAIAGFPT